jgi:hypothetical protein
MVKMILYLHVAGGSAALFDVHPMVARKGG